MTRRTKPYKQKLSIRFSFNADDKAGDVYRIDDVVLEAMSGGGDDPGGNNDSIIKNGSFESDLDNWQKWVELAAQNGLWQELFCYYYYCGYLVITWEELRVLLQLY